ncbi:class I SAM-dependent RNA methyltransferase [Leptospira biflexa]|uniref:class I SAM-dependent RNA methyltransferase n=1 Tax=Leptospira biflexa TaxID=172 RepID=UPI001090B601|nr:methyltransferase [Leptospira biflexa]TGM47014.1 class I SAM-dependent RNA methyltransferase [Leptospira biflexa]TGM50520.1 class I SAM-dependent RNA methyltransferase [Leptospira biflexa]
MEKLQIKLEKWVNGGYCLAHHDGHAVFIEGGLPGELVDITLTKQGKKEWFGVVTSVLEPSKFRIPSDCPVYLECGGCSYRHLPYEEELKLKTNLLESMFPKWKGKTEVIFGPMEGYRNNVQWQVVGNEIGFFEKNTHQIVSKTSTLCKNVDKRLLIENSKTFLTQNTKHQKIHRNKNQKFERSISLRLSNEKIVQYDLEETEIEVLGTKLKVPAKGFFQINQFLLETWLKKMKSLLPESSNVLELFCGCGTIGIALREKITSLYGIESHDNSIQYAIENAKRNGTNSFQYVTKDLYKGYLPKELKQYAIWIVNPPRSGLSKGIIDSTTKLKPKIMIYSSCNPSTLQRDLRLLEAVGYRMDSMSLFDFFPRTNHYEVLVRLKRG